MDARQKLLFLTASPAGVQPLNSGRELRDLIARIREALPAARFEVIAATATKRSELTHLLVTHKPDIVHFSGHGESKRGILLEDERGNTAAVDGKSLAALFAVLRGTLRIVVLNACSTKRTARAFQHIVDYAIAMNGPIHDVSAVAFATSFYDALAQGMDVPAAFAAGIAQLHVAKLPSKERPELFVAPGVSLRTPATDGEERSESSEAGLSIRKSRIGRLTIVSGRNNRVQG
jgi:CHAT domain-containing protein